MRGLQLQTRRRRDIMAKNAQWDMAFSGEAPDTDDAKEQFEQLFKEFCEKLNGLSEDSENHKNDNASWYSFESGSAEQTFYHERDIKTKAKSEPATAPKKT